MWFSLRIAVSSQHFYEDVKSTVSFRVIAGIHLNAPSTDTSTYFLYGTAIPSQPSFPYLGKPIGLGGYLFSKDLIQHILNKALQIMNQMSVIGTSNSWRLTKPLSPSSTGAGDTVLAFVLLLSSSSSTALSLPFPLFLPVS